MELHKAINLISALLGLIGSIFLSRSVAVVSPKVMLHLTTSYSRIGGNPEQISSMATQKADAWVGVIFILLTFLIQVINPFFDTEDVSFFHTKWMSFWVIILIVTLISISLNPAIRYR